MIAMELLHDSAGGSNRRKQALLHRTAECLGAIDTGLDPVLSVESVLLCVQRH